jgi:hypothetical protein
MNGASDHVFPRSALSADQQGRIRRRNFRQSLEKSTHRRTLPDHPECLFGGVL